MKKIDLRKANILIAVIICVLLLLALYQIKGQDVSNYEK